MKAGLQTLWEWTKHAEKPVDDDDDEEDDADDDDERECQALVVYSKTSARQVNLADVQNVLAKQFIQHNGMALLSKAMDFHIQQSGAAVAAPTDVVVGGISGDDAISALDQMEERVRRGTSDKPKKERKQKTWTQWFRMIRRGTFLDVATTALNTSPSKIKVLTHSPLISFF